MLRRLFRYSRFLHKYLGLLFLLYFLIMGLSGILLNHPDLLHAFSVSDTLVPASHSLDNGRKMAIRDTIVAGDKVFLAGRAGVWQSNDQGRRFSLLEAGFPPSAYDRETHCLHYDDELNRLFAGTRRGLYVYSFDAANWRQVARGTVGNQAVVDLLKIANRLLAVTPGSIYATRLDQDEPLFLTLPLQFRQSDQPSGGSLVHFLLKVHDGSLFGIAGRLFVDMVGAILVFLCVTGLFYWLFPRPAGSLLKDRGKAMARWSYHQHLDIGIWMCTFLVIVTLSGTIIRPPFLRMIADTEVPAVLLRLGQGESWQPRIDKAAFAADNETLWLATRSGFFTAPADLSTPFDKTELPVPTTGMGTNVLEFISERELLIGSFRGLHLWDKQQGKVRQIDPGDSKKRNRSALLATAALIDRGELKAVIDYRRGLIPLTAPLNLQLPAEFTHHPISLWHYLFELHNGRLFRQWLGAYTWLLIPIGGCLLLLVLLSGTYDWFWHKQKIKPRKR